MPSELPELLSGGQPIVQQPNYPLQAAEAAQTELEIKRIEAEKRVQRLMGEDTALDSAVQVALDERYQKTQAKWSPVVKVVGFGLLAAGLLWLWKDR